MTKYRLDEDEAYPVFSLTEVKDSEKSRGMMVELSDADFADYTRVMNEYYAWQDRLGGISTKSGH